MTARIMLSKMIERKLIQGPKISIQVSRGKKKFKYDATVRNFVEFNILKRIFSLSIFNKFFLRSGIIFFSIVLSKHVK